MFGILDYICWILGLIFTIFWIFLFFKGKKNATLFQGLDEKEYPLKDIYFVGYELLELIKYNYRTKYDRRLRKEISVLKDDKYADYYIRVTRAQQVTLGYTLFTMSFAMYGLAGSMAAVAIFIMFAFVAFYYYGTSASDKIKKRSEELLSDFSNVVSKLALLTNAGLIMRDAWADVAYNGDTTLDNEGRYDILKDQGFDVSTLTKENMDDKYNSVNDKWNSNEYKDYFNKSLTNKRLCKENNAAYGCELEYILYGHENNNENINAAYGQIYEIRYVLNLLSAFENFWGSGSTTGKMIDVVAKTISGVTGGVVPAVAIKAVLIALITVFETANDMNRLEAGFMVELYKNEAKLWQVSLDFGEKTEIGEKSISGMLNSIQTKFGNYTNSCENGLRYSDYLCIFMVCGMQSNIGESMTLRCADVIQANMRKITQDDGYKLENSKTYFELDSKLKVDPLLITLPLYSDYTDLYDSSSTDWCTYNIKTIRGY